jgi:hypothetical protein
MASDFIKLKFAESTSKELGNNIANLSAMSLKTAGSGIKALTLSLNKIMKASNCLDITALSAFFASSATSA